MALYIAIRKLAESATEVEYAFGFDERYEGRLAAEKATGQIRLLAPHPDPSKAEGLFQRASHKVRSHWLKGELPDRTCWAS